MIRAIVLLFLLIHSCCAGYSQCVSNVDFNTWIHEGPPLNGNWVVGGGGSSVNQTINGEPTFYLSPDTFINVVINGNITVGVGDDDWVGFVFGYKQPIGNSTYYDCYLFDWKQLIQGAGQEGFSLVKIQGNIPTGSNSTYFWDHTSDPTFQVLATDYGGNKGWIDNVTHQVTLAYTSSQITILVDGDTIFDIAGCYEPGRFGFYNYSQANVTYAGFDYEIDAQYNLITPQICAYDTGIFQFIDTSCSSIPTNLASWNWDFGDGNTSTAMNPYHAYNASGTYAVEMIITDNFGCSDSTTKTIIVQTNPIAGFTSTDICLGNTTSFTDNSVLTGGGSIISWLWDFDDGNTSTVQNPSNLYTSDGTYNVLLTITSDSGCIDTTTISTEVYPIPVAGFSVSDVCLYDTAFFFNTSSISSGSLTWIWDFNDGKISSSESPFHIYSTDSSYNVTLIVISDNSCTDTLTQTVQIFPAPLANFTSTSICFGESTAFTDQSLVINDVITTWSWLFGDGSPEGNSSSPMHLYTDTNVYEYNATLLVTTTSGCFDSITLPVTVHPLPVADFTNDTVCLGQPSPFLDTSSVSNGAISSYIWDFGDGIGTSTSQNPNYIYDADGTYTVQLTITTDSGCVDDTSISIGVFSLPVADYSHIAVCPGDTTFFIDKSTPDVVSWEWNFDDLGSTSIKQHAFYIYEESGFYYVQLAVINSNGCSDMIEKLVKAYEKPTAGFTVGPALTTLIAPFVDFNYTSSAASTFEWDLGNGFNFTTTLDTNFTYIYLNEDTATYLVQQIALNVFGCRDTFDLEVSVKEDFTIFLPNTFTPNNDGINETFSPKGIGLASNLKDYKFYIFNRWGDMVFETDDILESWDGTANNGNKLAPTGVYVWHIKLDVEGLGRHQYIGHTSLLY